MHFAAAALPHLPQPAGTRDCDYVQKGALKQLLHTVMLEKLLHT